MTDGLGALRRKGSQPSALLLCRGSAPCHPPYCSPRPRPGRKSPGEIRSWEPTLPIFTTTQCGRQARSYAAILWWELRLNEMPKVPSCPCQPEKDTDPTLRALSPKQPPGPAILPLGCRSCCTGSTESCVSPGLVLAMDNSCFIQYNYTLEKEPWRLEFRA